VQNLATPSAVTDGEVVVAHFGNGDLAAYDFQGQQLWRRNLQRDYGDYTIWWGHANSPVLYQDLVISICLQDSCQDLPGKPSPSYVVAHDKRTGEVRWFRPRPTDAPAESCDAYTTPLVWQRAGHPELVVMGGQILDGYDPASGQRLWWLPGLVGNRVITGPVAAEETIYATQGMRQALLAVRPRGSGERTRGDIVWKYDQGTPDSPTPVVWGELLFFVTDNGIARCLDLQTGQLKWKERLKGDYRASPLAAEGRIYFLNMKGLTTVVSASSRFDRLAENHLDDADHRFARGQRQEDLHPRTAEAVLRGEVRQSGAGGRGPERAAPCIDGGFGHELFTEFDCNFLQDLRLGALATNPHHPSPGPTPRPPTPGHCFADHGGNLAGGGGLGQTADGRRHRGQARWVGNQGAENFGRRSASGCRLVALVDHQAAA
jgi:outer membrane protein assembly factor BamB